MNRRVFADTFYWYGLANHRDQWHALVLRARAELGDCEIVTTDEVLTEFLNAMSGSAVSRAAAKMLVDALFQDVAITVLPQTRLSFLEGIDLYESRGDKGYSLTDCISMNACRSEGITEILTNDHHFTQEGFTVLITR